MTDQTAPKEEAKEPERNKIDSEEKLSAWLNKFSRQSRDQLNQILGGTTAIVRISGSTRESFWLKREIARTLYDFGQVYHPLPAAVADMLAAYGASLSYYHFVHLSTSDPTKIAYTETWESGMADRQQQISLGKYIKKYHPQVPEFAVKQCQEYLNNLVATAEVKFTTDLALIKTVYANAAPACMSKSVASYATNNMHPLEVYASHEVIKLAYLEPTPRVYTARSLVVDDPADKRYIRVYGDSLLAAQLDKLGYRRGSLAGVKLPKKVFQQGGREYVLCPYLDDHENGRQGTGDDQCVLVKDDHMLVTNAITPGAYPSNAEGRIRLPEWQPEVIETVTEFGQLVRDSTTGDLEHHHPMHHNEGPIVLGVLTAVRDRDDDVRRYKRYLRFRTWQEVNSMTRPLADGGRFMYTQDAINAWKIHTLVDAAGMSTGKNVSVLDGGGRYKVLTPTLYGKLDDGMFRYAQAARDEDTAVAESSLYILKRDARTITDGLHKGTVVHRRRAVTDYLDPNRVFHSNEVVIAWTNNGRQHIHKTDAMTFAHYGDDYFDRRDFGHLSSTGLIPGDQYFFSAGHIYDWSTGEAAQIGKPFDHAILRNRDTNTSVLFNVDDLEEVRPDPQLRKLADRIVIVDKDGALELCFTLSRTKDDVAKLHSYLNKPANEWIALPFRDLSTGEPFGNVTFRAALRLALMESIVAELDVAADNAETLIPQPETLAEPAEPVESSESEV